MLVLSESQQAAVKDRSDPVEVIDPKTKIRYLLVRVEDDEASRQVRVAGRLNLDVGNTEGRFTLHLADGSEVAGIAKNVNLDELAKLQGEQAVVLGRAVFDASGTLLRVEAERVTPARPADLNVFSKAPKPLNSKLDVASLRRPQGPNSGIAAIIGQWPGDETDEEVEAFLKEIS